ncbi:pyridoxal phosphate-dependent decarboxylase family protein [Hwangdonia sp.]|uniref:pyridoxal phosphate-dependent decarboxylase family protein n=1 Tax=Hwangdonia sp. TaxID=1883432 RepID=UPI003AB87B85
MNAILKKDKEQINLIFDDAIKESLDYLKNIETTATSKSNKTIKSEPLTNEGLGAQKTLQKFIENYKPIIVASSGPRYWGFVTGGSTPASIVGDWLASVYDQNTQAISGHGDNSAQIEINTINLLLELFQLPKTFIGGFVTGATMSNFTCLAVARQWLGKKLGTDIAKEGFSKAKPIKIYSATPHASALKSLAMLGFGSKNIIPIKTIDTSREALDVDDLELKIKAHKQTPFILISSAGTVNSGDFDDFSKIAELKTKYDFWWHIDAAFGAFASCSPKYIHLLKEWEQADSITTDNHKWLNVPYENATFFIKEKHKELHVNTFQNSNAPYLGDIFKNFNYLNLLPENSRRLKALPVWFTLNAYGKKGYMDIVENNIRLAGVFGTLISESKSFKLLTPVKFNIVAFTLKATDKASIDKFLSTLSNRGNVFITPTVFNGRNGFRAAFVNWRTTLKDVQMALKEMETVLTLLKNDSPSSID